jgi:hypothetical protein
MSIQDIVNQQAATGILVYYERGLSAFSLKVEEDGTILYSDWEYEYDASNSYDPLELFKVTPDGEMFNIPVNMFDTMEELLTIAIDEEYIFIGDDNKLYIAPNRTPLDHLELLDI